MGWDYFFAPGLGAGFAGCPLLAIFGIPPLFVRSLRVGWMGRIYFFAPGLGAGFAGCPLLAIFGIPPSVRYAGYHVGVVTYLFEPGSGRHATSCVHLKDSGLA